MPGPRFRGQFGGVLLPGNHRGGSLAHGHAVRAFHFQGAQRAPRHRRGFRAREARRGHPVHLSQVRPRTRGTGGHRHFLSSTQRAARCRQGAGPQSRGSRQAGAQHAVVGRRAHRSRADSRRGLRSRCSAHAARHGPHRRDHGISASSLAACRRFRHRARPPRRTGAHRKCGHARSHGDPMGQGRPRCLGVAQGRRAGTRHALRDPPRLRPGERFRRTEHGGGKTHPGNGAGRGSGRVRHDLPCRHRRRVSDRIAGADGDAAAPAAAQLL